MRYYGKRDNPTARIGESWECWNDDTVCNGAVEGSAQAFPVLTKIITAHDWLSVLVHPNDVDARRVEHQRVSQTECWYVMAARADAELVVVWTRDTSRAEYKQRARDGTPAEVLRKIHVKAGDTNYVPAGLVRAIGAGVNVFETQQTSDLTYRLLDWNRAGLDARPRALHIAKAADVLDYQAGGQTTLAWIDYRFERVDRTALITDYRFTVELVIATYRNRRRNRNDRPVCTSARRTSDRDLRLPGACADCNRAGNAALSLAAAAHRKALAAAVVATALPRIEAERRATQRRRHRIPRLDSALRALVLQLDERTGEELVVTRMARERRATQ